MHRAMRLRCLLRPPPISLGTPSAAGGRFGAPDGVRTLGAPFSERGRLLRFYSSKEEGVGNAETAAGSGGSSNQQEHARLGEKDQQEWLSGERFLTGCKRRESPFLTKRERFRNEFLRRVVPWHKSSLTWTNFPYYVDNNARQLLTECVASHLRNKDAASEYGSPARLLLRIFAIRLGVDPDEPSHDAILPIPRRGPAPPWAPSRTPTSPRTTTIKASSSTTSGSHRASPTRPRASRPRRVPSRVRVELQQVLADVRVLAARPQRAARAYSVRVGQG